MSFASFVQRLLGRQGKARGSDAHDDTVAPPTPAAKAPLPTTGVRSRRVEAAERAIRAEPDHPCDFGYKTQWFAIRTEEPEAVIAALELSDVRRANWASGLACAYELSDTTGTRYAVFVTPPVNGWVLAVGKGLPALDEMDEGGQRRCNFFSIFGKIASRFSEVQYFGTYRVVGYDAWFRARDGLIERGFSIADSQVYANIGRQTAEEWELGFLDLGERGAEAAGNYIFESMEREDSTDTDEADKARLLPHEENTMALAGAWSIDPTTLASFALPASVGYLGYLPTLTH
jgi:hypothetical protein